MGIQVSYRRLSEPELDSLEADPRQAMEFLFSSSMPSIDPEVMAAILADPETMQQKAAELLAAMQQAPADTSRVDLDSDWHALHFLLTGDNSMEPSYDEDDPLHNVVMGGHPTKVEATYGPARCFSQVEVYDMVQALSEITVEELRARFSADEFNAARIYPNPRPGGWNAEEVEGVFHLYPRLCQLFKDALKNNELVLVYAG